MSNFFKALVDLGEEDGEKSSTSLSQELATMTTKELHALVGTLTKQKEALSGKHTTLLEDSNALRGEYDAYKQKVESWQRQMKEARENDRKMIDQLRTAGSSTGDSGGGAGDGKGDVDAIYAVYAKNMKEEVSNYKESLREAREAVSKAVKKQREAEEQRAAIENSKKRELDELSVKFDKLKEKVKASSSIQHHISQLQEPGSPTPSGGIAGESQQLERLRHRLSHAESEVDAIRGKNGALEQEVLSLRDLLANTNTQSSAAKSTISDTASNGDETQQQQQQAATGEKLRYVQVELVSLKSELASTQAQLKMDQADLQDARNSESSAKEEVRRQEATLNRKIEDLEWEGVEVEKKLAEVRLQLEGSHARAATLENRLDAKESERNLLEKDLRRSLRELEDNLENERQSLAEATRVFQGKESTLHGEMTRALEQAAKTNALVGEAEQQQSDSKEQLEEQKRRYEDHIFAMERQVREADATRSRLESMIYELREETRHRDDVIEDLRQELDTTTMRTQDLEQLQVHQTRTLTTREDELLSRERERQKLRQELAEREEEVARLQADRRTQEGAILNHHKEKERVESRLAEAMFQAERLQAEQHSQSRLLGERSRGLELTEQKMVGLESDLAEERRQHADARQQLDRELTKASQRADEKTNLLSSESNAGSPTSSSTTALTVTSQAISSAKPASHVTPPLKSASVDPISAASAAFTQSRTGRGRYVGTPVIPSSFPGERGESGSVAMTLKRLTWSQWRVVIAGAVFFVIILSLINSTSYSSGQPTRFESENMFNVREKYEQALASLSACRENLKNNKVVAGDQDGGNTGEMGGASPAASP